LSTPQFGQGTFASQSPLTCPNRHIPRTLGEINIEKCIKIIFKDVDFFVECIVICLLRGLTMEIRIIKAFDNVKDYVKSVKKNSKDLNELWNKYMVEPFWAEISQWAPFDVSFMKPKPVENIDMLEEQYNLLSKLPIENIRNKFEEISKMLPINEDDTPLIVALYPLCNNNKIVKKYQNGVVGCCVFGNICININPLAKDYNNWIPFVFAHEYNHSVWGNVKYGVQGGKNVEGTFLEYMITEGQADVFAESLYPNLKPQWNIINDRNKEIIYWEKIKPILFRKDREIHNKFMLGNEEEEMPWCIGYYFGKVIVEDYLRKYNDVSFKEIINIPAIEILNSSRFKENS
jgi:uncharacterized protein YjaZ